MPTAHPMAKTLIKTLLQSGALALLLLPISAAAAVFDGGGLAEGLAQARNSVVGVATGTLDGVVDDTVGRIIGFTALAATVVIIIAGFYLILGLGNDDNKEKAKKIILYTSIGIMVIGLASVFVSTIFFVLSGEGDGNALKESVSNIVERILNFLTLISVVAVIIAGIYLVVSLGNDDNKDKAKKIVIFTLAGLMVVLFAKVIVSFVTDVIGDSADVDLPPSASLDLV